MSWFSLLRKARYEAQKRKLLTGGALYLVRPAVYSALLDDELEQQQSYSVTSFSAEKWAKMTFPKADLRFDDIPVGVLNRDIPFDAVLVLSDLPPREIRFREDGTMVYYEYDEVSQF